MGGANFAATGIGCRSFQGNFNADLRFVQDFPSSSPSCTGQGATPPDRLLSTPVEQDGKRFRSMCQEGSVSAQVQVYQPKPEVLLGAGVHGDVHQGGAWPVSLRRGGRLDCGQAETVHQEKWA